MEEVSGALKHALAAYRPRVPEVLRGGVIELGERVEPTDDVEAIREMFPSTFGQQMATVVAGTPAVATEPLRVGVVLSGGPAPGGHNVIAGLYDALKAAHPESVLLGFTDGPIGVIDGQYIELTEAIIDAHRNTGGFDMLRTGRDKIEKPEQLKSCHAHLTELKLNALVVIGGDDSNTNAAVLAEYLKAQGSSTVVVGVPKTIDGDMRNDYIEASFGFDTACKTYAELIGNIARDCRSAAKYWHFVRLMGRAASHVALECALQTHPNVCLVSEEIGQRGLGLADVVEQIAHVVIERVKQNRRYGLVLLPEGLIEFMPDIKAVIGELEDILKAHGDYLKTIDSEAERVEYVISKMSAVNAKVYGSLPVDAQQVLLRRDKHGYVLVSQIETDRLLADLVGDRIREWAAESGSDYKFSVLTHFLGYEGRCGFPTRFDADYAYSLGATAAQFVRAGLTGYTVYLKNLLAKPEDWQPGGLPVTMMLNLEKRKGKLTPVIRKFLVDLEGGPFQKLAAERDGWSVADDFRTPGPIQLFGPAEVCEQPTITLRLERG